MQAETCHAHCEFIELLDASGGAHRSGPTRLDTAIHASEIRLGKVRGDAMLER